MFTLGIDLGTQGVRAVVSDRLGRVAAASGAVFEKNAIAGADGCSEQDVLSWWDTVICVIRDITGKMKEKGCRPEDILALSVDGTSGTVTLLDKDHTPLCAGIMYNDSRAAEEAAIVGMKAASLEKKLGYSFNSSFALPKVLRLKNRMPESFKRCRYVVHQSDFIVGRLTGVYNVSDYSNALKSGYDLLDKKWPELIEDELGIEIGILPEIVRPGAAIANISNEASRITGLSTRTVVTAGATDGYASAIASGIAEPGDFNTTLGTTMVIKGITRNLIHDKEGRVYCHLHPDGYWMPGGASNVGGRCLNNRFDSSEFAEYDKGIGQITPTGILAYPLVGKGERFPFLNKEAEEFITGNVTDKKHLFAALMEGVAYSERLAYDTLYELGCEPAKRIFVTGGAVKSMEWSQIRANVLNTAILIPRVFETAMGSAIIAASGTLFSSLKEASCNMVGIREAVNPQPEKAEAYEELYDSFKKECKARGYN